MSLTDELRAAIREGKIQPIFCRSDLRLAGIEDPHHNLANYDRKNKGSTNIKVLVSREINGELYYTFDEKLLD